MAEPVQVVLICHVESGFVRDRTIVFDRTHVEGVSEALPRIAEFADREGVPVALALTPQAVQLTKMDLAGFPLGLHLHPQDDALAARLGHSVQLKSDCLAQYASADQTRLVSAGVEAVAEATGRRPDLFVAGNWSENGDTVRIVEAAGFRYDGSPLPGHVSPCADWGRLPRLVGPYRPSHDDYQSAGDSGLLYLPVFQGYWGDYLSPENLHYLGVRYFLAALREAAIGRAGLIHMYFHSPMALDPFFFSEFSRVIDEARDEHRARFVRPESIVVETVRSGRPFPPAYFAYLDRTILKSLFVRRFPSFAPEMRTAMPSG